MSGGPGRSLAFRSHFMTRKQFVGLAIVFAAMGAVAYQYFQAASTSLAASRASACRALAPNPVPPAMVGVEAPDFELADASGKKWSLRSLRGRPVLLNFWATWCAPCVEEMPSMEELARRLGDRAVVLAVSVDENWDLVKNFFGARGTPLSLLLDVSKEVPKRYGTEKYPETFLIDSRGVVQQYFINKRKWDVGEALFCVDSAQ